MPKRIPLMEKARWERAKAWGEQHGYYWMLGGYIYREGETRLNRKGEVRSVCHGWHALYNIMPRRIDQWCETIDAYELAKENEQP